MLVLGIESSCDDTSVALLNCSDQGHLVIAEKTASQIDIHKKYGGVVPELAARAHAEAIVPLIEEVLTEASAKSSALGNTNGRQPPLNPPLVRGGNNRPDVIAVTAGPGLITALLVGVEAGRTLSYAWKTPLVAVNHIAGHIHSVELNGRAIEFPALALVVSGGHTELVLMAARGDYKILGATKDDAAGECFDKVGKLLDLPYPGGPEISKLAELGNPQAIAFPRPMLTDKKRSIFRAPHPPNYNFSFAGLKTAALYWLRDHSLSPLTKGGDRGVAEGQATESIGKGQPLLASPWKGERVAREDFCASLEQAIVDVLVAKTISAALQYQPKTVVLCGGVAANKKLRQTLAQVIAERCQSSAFRVPRSAYCMDNAAMIAVAGYYQAKRGGFTPWQKLRADPNWKIT